MRTEKQLSHFHPTPFQGKKNVSFSISYIGNLFLNTFNMINIKRCEPVLHGFPPGSLHSFFVFALHHVNTCHRASSHQRACRCLQQKCLQTCIRQTTEFFLLPVLYLFIFTLFHFHILSPIPIPPERS